MVVNMYIIGPKKDQFKPVFFGLFDFSKMKRPRPRLQKTNKWSFLVLVLFDLSPVQLQFFASPRTGLSNTSHEFGELSSLVCSFFLWEEYWLRINNPHSIVEHHCKHEMGVHDFGQ